MHRMLTSEILKLPRSGESFFFRKYPILSSHVMTRLVPFPTTYMCETGFSAMVAIKHKAKSRLILWGDLRCALPLTKPGFKGQSRANAHSGHKVINWPACVNIHTSDHHFAQSCKSSFRVLNVIHLKCFLKNCHVLNVVPLKCRNIVTRCYGISVTLIVCQDWDLVGGVIALSDFQKMVTTLENPSITDLSWAESLEVPAFL